MTYRLHQCNTCFGFRDFYVQDPDDAFDCSCGGRLMRVDLRGSHLDFCAGGEVCTLDDCLCRCHREAA